MSNSFKLKLKNLDMVLKDIISELQSCPINRLDIQAEQVLEIIYNFTDTLAEIEELRYNGTAEDFSTSQVTGQSSTYEDFDYIDEEVDLFPDQDTESYTRGDND